MSSGEQSLRREVAAIEVLDPSAVRRWCTGAVAALEAARAEIDDLNVYPVPDGDTGTNLLLTLQAADSAVRTDPPGDLAATLGSMARGAVLGARGNSGVILSQVLRGLAEALPVRRRHRAGRPRAGRRRSRRAAELAWEAVAEPVEGTMLSVVRGAADAAGGRRRVARRGGQGRRPRRRRARWSARPTSCRCWPGPAWWTPAAAVCACCWRRWPRSSGRRAGAGAAAGRGRTAPGDGPGDRLGRVRLRGAVPARRRRSAGRLRAELAELGDSLVVVGTGEGTWTVHVHVNDIGAAIEAGVRAGRPYRITVTRFADEPPRRARAGTAVVAVAPGAGVAELFAAEGVLLADGTEDAVLDAGARRRHRRRGGAAAGRAELTATADAAADRARDAGVEVAVVPTRSPVQGLAAVAVHDEGRRFGDDIIAMAEAAAATRWAEVFPATRDALTMAGPCRAGDVLGLVDGDVVVVGGDLPQVAAELLERMLSAGGELVTLVLAAAEVALADRLERQVAHDHPGVEVAVHGVSRPDVPLLIGVE